MSAILIASAASDVDSLLRNPLREAGYGSISAASAGEAFDVLRAWRATLALVDLDLPPAGGLALCRRIRAGAVTANLPIVVIASEGAESDRRLDVLDFGVDDVVSRPFSVRELVLRIRAVLRRSRADSRDARASPLAVGSIMLDLIAHRAFVDGAEVHMTPLEFRLLAALMVAVGRVRARKDLLVEVWASSPLMNTRTVDTHVKRLRAKLGASGRLLQTVRSIGYRLAAPGASTQGLPSVHRPRARAARRQSPVAHRSDMVRTSASGELRL
jgi:two-component system phosphate regulon response regulator PhoB